MGEIKSVKVDNWGVFFLQKLQNFFNKTDYCDLTLQFRDNSQLKVHRLVLSACTDYFNVLEQTCEVVDDAIIMPNGLQADVVVPIVNFMYTGTLEFELKMYNRLLRTAKDMNMTVLLKLLEAHRRTMEMHPQKSAAPASPKPRRKTAAQTPAAGSLPTNPGGRSLIQTNQGKRLVIGSNNTSSQQRHVSAGNTLTRLPTTGQLPVRQIGSTTFTRIKVENEQHHETNTSTSAGGYTLLKQSSQQQQPQQPTSPFEQLRKGYNNNKRPAVSTFVSPPAKKPNLEDVKEFAEQQRMRKQIAAEYGDDDYDASNIMDDDTIHNDDDDDEITPQTSTTSTSAGVQTVSSQQTQQQQSEDPPGTTTIIVKHEGPDKPPTIVVKDNSNSKMNHAKIISEVLRQYPHLVKSNKNIKLKIMPNAGGQAQKIIVKKEPMEPEKQMQPPPTKLPVVAKISESSKSLAASIVANRPKPLQQQQQAEITSSAVKTTQSGMNKAQATSGTSAATTTAQPQKRRIDSKTMHALIALGAENTTGPWLCLRCGRNGHPISIPSYRGFRRHLINTHKETIDPALCEHCGWRSSSKRELHFHMQLEHKVKTNLYIFPECQLCQQMCIDSDGLNQHLIDSHPDENKQQCIYCNKIFPEELQLYTHMKTFHKKQAIEDGIIDYSDDENQGQATLQLPPAEYDQEMEVEHKEQTQQEKKINILSDISLPIASSIIKTDSFIQQHESTTSVASEEYLQDQEHEQQEHTETKFVAADGSEVILTPEQRKEILSQLNQEHEGSGVVMVVNENPQQQSQYASGETQSDQGAISHDETSQATTATNEEHPEEEEEVEEEHERVAEEEEDDQHDDNQIYNEMKALHSNIEDDSTSQTEAVAEAEEEPENDEEPEPEQEEEGAAEHDQRAEHLEESKESIDNLEWAENLLSEHDLADEVSSSQATESTKTQEKEEELKDEDNKSQDEISKKLKELTGDWSEDDDDDDMPEEEPLPEITQMKEIVKEKPQQADVTDVEMAETEEEKESKTVRPAKEQEETPEFEDHAELLASLQSTDKEDLEEHKDVITETAQSTVEDDAENIDEDDIDMALKSLHKEDLEEVDDKNTEAVEESSVKEENEAKEKTDKPPVEEAVVDKLTNEETEKLTKNDEIIEEKTEAVKETKNTEVLDEDKPEEKLVKELATLAEPEATATAMEVDEETKKDLIDSLLSEQAETMEETANETSPTTTAAKIEEVVDKMEIKIENSAEIKTDTEDTKTALEEDTPSLEDEFLNIAADKDTNEESAIDNNDITTATTSTTTTAAAVSATESANTTEVAEASSTTAKEDATISSEERVKSLISEWGDDEDEDDNDTDLTANL
ncbi:centrosome-associated zinc finger protein CP190 [Lucilia cuprina]|uniref:centrosome-associated zinc finger protein CP190 n=1 Tax=Lucilia cuprina TaxID=7375 RepID=UPI001F05924B|nr:centrosome-associated zinc finger protein CP190 [Lucilia cuprina]XP_023299457.2 centrosome-associated zinc finger protein CP190 [Lucilia cuprina]XP_023299458.2 centrosome-associated zinc finger protein CP190 [Lucilia cuprina]XP_046804223.1 centrosome-associated zinc finger protein CP190 [Lucilia cuprina]XP_046804224.1 centrosome-associated zinc finger protein CP190 [Lucilia cuprina]